MALPKAEKTPTRLNKAYIHIDLNAVQNGHAFAVPKQIYLGPVLMLTHWPLVIFSILIYNVLQQQAKQAPAAQDAAGACLAGYCS